MKPPEDINKYFQKATLSTNPDRHEAVFEKILSTHEQVNKQKPESNRICLGRFIMKNPISKIAAAAALIIMCMTGLIMFNKTSSIAIGDVLKKIEQINSYMCQIISAERAINVDKNLPAREVQCSILESKEYGTKIMMNIKMLKGEDINNVKSEVYILPKKNIYINIIHTQKLYNKREITDKLLEESYFDFMKIFKKVDESKIKSLGKSTLDGIEVEEFQFNDPDFMAGELDLGKIDVKLWVDIRTQLPIIMEMESLTETQHIVATIRDFQWNVPVSAVDFEPMIPPDYRSISDIISEINDLRASLPGYNEEIAIQGLKLFADVSGQYPSKLDSVIIINEFGKFRRQNNFDANRIQELSNGHKVTELITEIRFFFKRLEREKKDPAYYGGIVTPADANQVLLRWKVSDKNYRVIFGDLKAETVTSETLAVLEKSLPK